jgi:hypothetical protein
MRRSWNRVAVVAAVSDLAMTTGMPTRERPWVRWAKWADDCECSAHVVAKAMTGKQASSSPGKQPSIAAEPDLRQGSCVSQRDEAGATAVTSAEQSLVVEHLVVGVPPGRHAIVVQCRGSHRDC